MFAIVYNIYTMSRQRKSSRRSIIDSYTGKLPDTAMRYVLEALLPYSDANLKLAYKPHAFFNDLEKISRYSRASIRKAYYTARRQGLVTLTDAGTPILSELAIDSLRPYTPQRLDNSKILVMFDIPESLKARRSTLRLALKELRFQQVQKSVWSSKYDSRDILRKIISNLAIDDYVEIFEALPIRL